MYGRIQPTTTALEGDLRRGGGKSLLALGSIAPLELPGALMLAAWVWMLGPLPVVSRSRPD
ncbi:hypothetical protein [Halorubrum vacuolatum]|uniref:hypothetical protein n=1 Tax=Halorubrum vacuolatum TaxID=63740 RepID=UPI00117A75FE|nr:hypothetical protein [Halorubrum vacuolatum]